MQIENTTAKATGSQNAETKNTVAFNSVTGFYWTGKSFDGRLLDAALLNKTELAALRYTYDNVDTQETQSGRRVLVRY